MTDRLQELMAFHEASPQDDFATYAIAQEHIKAGDTDEALRWIEKTLQIAATRSINLSSSRISRSWPPSCGETSPWSSNEGSR